MREFFARWWWLLPLIPLAVLYWGLPISGTVLVSSLPFDPDAHFPQYIFDPPSPQPGDEVSISITDNVPWTHVKLTVNGKPATFVQTQAIPLRSQWNWSWRATLPQADQTNIEFYRDCNSGCQLRDQRTIEPFAAAGSKLPKPHGKPTKLCVAFPNPQRDWHGRSGWVTDLTYAQTDERYWQIDALAQRVAQSHQAGQRVLVRVDYAPQQSIPPTDDIEALDLYLNHIRKLSRDERFKNVYAYVIGTGFNSLDSNNLSPDAPTTPQWYARIFNGGLTQNNLGENRDPSASNVIQVLRANNPLARVLVGPVRPWTSIQRDMTAATELAPWLVYMDTLTTLIDENVVGNLAAGIALTEPDGFALNVSGRVDHRDPNDPVVPASDPAFEPRSTIISAHTFGAQIGFGIHREWLDIINRYPSTRGKPAFITSTSILTYNELTANDSAEKSESEPSTPAQNYPSGWLTNALSVINNEPQIQSLCWFLDLIPDDQRWRDFSLSQGEGRMKEAADEFDRLLQGE